MLTNCPHCFTRVVPRSDGSCPACQSDTHDTAVGEPSRTPIHVWQGDILPPICCGCGQRTSRVVSVYRKMAPEGDPVG